MFDEQAFITRVEGMELDDFAHLLECPAADEETALRWHLGDARFQRLHRLALSRGVRHGERTKENDNVVVIHGFMGSTLVAVDNAGQTEQLWPNALGIASGWLQRLRLAEDGRSPADEQPNVEPGGMMKRHYGELLLSLSQNWNVRPFVFDWRKDLQFAAAELGAQLIGWFGVDVPERPVHIVAHSMGGLVVRTFMGMYPERWKDMRKAGGRLIMLGTPSYGSFVVPQMLAGRDPAVRELGILHDEDDPTAVLKILNSFPGLYQLLPWPWPERQPTPTERDWLQLYDASTYNGREVSQRHLRRARQTLASGYSEVDPEGMVYIAGTNRPTPCTIKAGTSIDDPDAFEMTMAGDGFVTHELGLPRRGGQPVGTCYYVEEQHGNLTSNLRVLEALEDLLQKGKTARLPETPPPTTTLPDREEPDPRAPQIRMFLNRTRQRSRDGSPAASQQLTFDRRMIEEGLTRNLLAFTKPVEPWNEAPDVPFQSAMIEMCLVQGDIEKLACDDIGSTQGHPVDAIAVGQYLGVRPSGPVRAVDEDISRALHRRFCPPDHKFSPEDHLLRTYSERGIIRGELGQPFFMNDPRQEHTNGGADRVIAVAGMGLPGRFGEPELTVLARELVWSLGRMGKHHLATILIGSGHDNLGIQDAVSGWIRGVKHAITGTVEAEQRRLKRITFVESDPRKIRAIDETIRHEAERLQKKGRLTISYEPLTPEMLDDIDQKARDYARTLLEHEWKARRNGLEGEDPAEDPPSTRVSVSLDKRGVYRFGAITLTASIPEREIPLDPNLVMQANDEIVAEWNPERQIERGRFMAQLLVPQDLRTQLSTDVPLVMLLDSNTARIHWEVLAHADPLTPVENSSGPNPGAGYFLGKDRGLTRQLRATFAPPPEPPPPPRRVLRVLVVADPAEEMRLPGAEAEGAEVAALFESFNRAYETRSDNRIEVVTLLGPREATRTTVLRHLMLRHYDLLHFAGHCVYDKDVPMASGWIFSKGERVTANELRRIDRIPKFVFSNACESGVTPERSEQRNADLAPTFAEAFFERGIANFVCTAWPVDDMAARRFALSLYGALLGLKPRAQGRGFEASDEEEFKFKPMFRAMRDARSELAETGQGIRTWGAYQHYGNPYLRIFSPRQMEPAEDGAEDDDAVFAAEMGNEAPSSEDS